MLRNVLARQLRAGPEARSGRSTGRPGSMRRCAVGIAGDRRPQTLCVEEWLRLLDALDAGPRRRGRSRDDRAADPLQPVVRLAPAKLNLTLAVTGHPTGRLPRPHSVIVPLGLGDRLSLARAAGSEDSLHVVGGADGRTPLDPAGFDSVARGIAAARRVVGRTRRGFPLALRLEKRIPIAAGLAGGSSDAAAAIDGALEAWGAAISPRRPARGRRRHRRGRAVLPRRRRRRSWRAAASASRRSRASPASRRASCS